MMRLMHETDGIALYIVRCMTGCTNNHVQQVSGRFQKLERPCYQESCLSHRMLCCTMCLLHYLVVSKLLIVCKTSAQDTRNTRTGFCTTICMCKSVKVLGIVHFPSLCYCISAPTFDCQLLIDVPYIIM